jgi:hypothetical protein
MLTGDEGDSVCHADDPLAGEQLVRNHRVFAEFPLPDYKGDEEEEADDKLCEHIGALPRV